MSHTVSDIADEFLVYLGTVRGLSQNTVTAYKNELDHFASMEQIGAERVISDITTEEIRLCVGDLSLKKRSPASINQFISAVRALFSYARKFGYIDKNPALEIKSVKIPKRLPRFMTGAEVDNLCSEPEKLEILWEKRDRAIFEAMYSSGCRVSELAGLTFEDLSADLSSAIVHGKGGKDRRVYFEADACKALDEYLCERKERFAKGKKIDLEKALFVNQQGKKLSVRGITYILDRYSGAEGTNRHVSPHAFRHTFATAMLTKGADIRLVQELLGHSSISTTQRYTHISTDQLIASYNKAHPHGGEKES